MQPPAPRPFSLSPQQIGETCARLLEHAGPAFALGFMGGVLAAAYAAVQSLPAPPSPHPLHTARRRTVFSQSPPPTAPPPPEMPHEERPDAAALGLLSDAHDLGIGLDASPADIRAAFRARVASGIHPDHGGDAAKMRALLEARERLIAYATRQQSQSP